MTTQAAVTWFGISRQAYFQAKQRQQQQEAENQLILNLVKEKRRLHPQMGGRKLYHELRPRWENLEITRGRDAFFDLLRAHDLLIVPKRNRRRTTLAGSWRCPNRLAGLTLATSHQAWVGDITYITTETGFVYLTLLTDAFSRFIVGYDISASLATEGCLRALQQAINQARCPVAGLIHHSDHGVQYTSWSYRDCLQEHRLLPSMGEVGNCYDNALAERMNGILKNEYGLDDLFVNLVHAQQAVAEAVWLYNYDRPHLSLGYAKPAEIHFDN